MIPRYLILENKGLVWEEFLISKVTASQIMGLTEILTGSKTFGSSQNRFYNNSRMLDKVFDFFSQKF